MFFVQRFDPKPGVSHEQIQGIYRRLAAAWTEVWPTNTLVGLFVRKWGVGAKPDYLAIWDLPNAAAMDEWDTSWEGVKERMIDIENEFWSAVDMVETKLMDRVKMD
jgi:hypothetical protein